MAKVIGSCKNCGVRIEYWPSQARTYCSFACKGIDRAKGGMPVKPRTGTEVPCANCQKPVYRQKHQLEKQAFCGNECKAIWQARGRKSTECAQCGSVFEQAPSRSGKYCSRECMGAANYRRPLDRMHNGKPAVIDHVGYVRIYAPTHPGATRGGWIYEHRWVVEQALGRVLARDENVHHINHIRHDNRPENLELLTHNEHSKVTARENGEALKVALELRQKVQEYERRFGPIELELLA